MLHGIQGLLNEKVCDLSERLRSFIDIELLKRIYHLTRDCGYTLDGVRDQLRTNTHLDEKMQLVQTLTQTKEFLLALKDQL